MKRKHDNNRTPLQKSGRRMLLAAGAVLALTAPHAGAAEMGLIKEGHPTVGNNV